MSEITYGDKYDRSLTTTQIAAAFRADVKRETAAGNLPRGLKLSVKTRYFSGGSSIDVKLVAVPEGLPVRNPGYDPSWRAPESINDPLSPELRAALKLLASLLDAYNFDGSDIQTDYFHVRFYGHVELDSRLREEVYRAA